VFFLRQVQDEKKLRAILRRMLPGYRTILGKTIRLPLRLIPDGSVVRVVRGPLKGQRWITGSSIHGCWLGAYEADKVAWIAKQPLAGKLFVDIGANVGFYSLLAARMGANVIAFEPLPRNLTYLRRHNELNQCNIDIRAAALSDRAGKLHFDSQRNSSEGRLAESGDLVVDSYTLDSLGIEPQFLKIDVEGAEARVLEGARATLQRSKPTIFLATHGAQVEAECLKLLAELGYGCTQIEESEYVCTAG
jgi:FkbM family methyltransferase